MVCALILSHLFFSLDFLDRHDLVFHMNRIEGICEGLRSGQFPVRIHAYQLNGYGFPIGVFYPDLFLYIPALLRFAGVSMALVYNLYGIVTIFIGVFLSWYAFSFWQGSLRMGAVSSVLYNSFYFYLFDTYFAGAIGSVWALAFYPLAFASLWSVLHGEQGERRWPLVVLSFTAVFQSHLINSLLLAAGTVFFCLFSLGRFRLQSRRRAAMKAAFFTVLLNLWFWVPFLYFYRNMEFHINDSLVNSLGSLTGSWGDMVTAQFWWGWPLVVLGAVFLACQLRRPQRWDSHMLAAFGVGVLTMLMATEVFPWGLLERLPLVGAFLMKLQFPQRILPLGAVFLALCLGRFLVLGLERFRHGVVLAGVFCFLVCSVNMYSIEHFSSRAGGQYIAWTPSYFSLDQLPSYGSFPEDYLYRDIVFTNLRNREGRIPEPTDIYSPASLTDVKKQGTTVSFAYQSDSPSSVQLPLFYYPGYRAVDAAGQELSVGQTEQHFMTLELPPGKGQVQVWYRGLTAFRVADGISLLGALAFCGVLYWDRRRRDV